MVGASGVIFGYLGLLLMRGVVERSWWNIAVVLLVGLLYGWQLFGVLPTDEGISWQGHLFGLHRRGGRGGPVPRAPAPPVDLRGGAPPPHPL